jgi:hypothetical protein
MIGNLLFVAAEIKPLYSTWSIRTFVIYVAQLLKLQFIGAESAQFELFLCYGAFPPSHFYNKLADQLASQSHLTNKYRSLLFCQWLSDNPNWFPTNSWLANFCFKSSKFREIGLRGLPSLLFACLSGLRRINRGKLHIFVMFIYTKWVRKSFDVVSCKLHMLQMKEGFLLNAFGANGLELIDIADSPYPELDLAAQIERTSQGNLALCLKVY